MSSGRRAHSLFDGSLLKWRLTVMKKGSLRRFVAVGIFGIVCSVLNTGCSWNDVRFGFSAGVGAIPANIIGNYIAGLLFANNAATP